MKKFWKNNRTGLVSVALIWCFLGIGFVLINGIDGWRFFIKLSFTFIISGFLVLLVGFRKGESPEDIKF